MVPFADPGIAVDTFPNRPGVIGGFKTPTLWGAADTPPYFHDGSSLTIAEMFDHYNLFFARLPQFGPELSPEEIADATAYLHLLGVQG
jgi:cytochrome c peroxidase